MDGRGVLPSPRRRARFPQNRGRSPRPAAIGRPGRTSLSRTCLGRARSSRATRLDRLRGGVREGVSPHRDTRSRAGCRHRGVSPLVLWHRSERRGGGSPGGGAVAGRSCTAPSRRVEGPDRCRQSGGASAHGLPSATLCGRKCGRNLLAWLGDFCLPVDLSELDFRPQLEKPADPGVNRPEFEPRVFDFPKLLLQRLERTRDVPRARHWCRTSPASAWPGLLKYFRAAGSGIKTPGGPRISRTQAGPVPRARVPRLPAEGPRYPGPDHALKRVESMSQEQCPRPNRPTARDSQVIRPVLSIPPLPQMFLGFVRQFPHDLSRLLDALHAIHGLPGPQRHRVERPGRRLVGDERGARLYGNANVRSPRLYGLTDELSLEPLDRLDTGTQV